MKHVGIREFRDHATKYFAGDEIVAIERHGETIGYYMPATNQAPELPKISKAEAMEQLGQIVNEMLDRTGLTEDELSRLFDVKQPIPEDVLAKLEAHRVAASRATGG